MSIGITFPFAAATGSLGYLEVTSDIAAAIQSNVRSLLLTNWGERVMHADFGCNMIEFIFEPRTRQLRERIADRVKSQLSRWMPFLSLSGLYVIFSDEDPSIPENGVGVKLELFYGNIPVELYQVYPR